LDCSNQKNKAHYASHSLLVVFSTNNARAILICFDKYLLSKKTGDGDSMAMAAIMLLLLMKKKEEKEEKKS
jgi:hypothetical protein